MKPVAIFRHKSTEGPGYLADFLDEKAIPWQLIRIDSGDQVPEDASQFSGLVSMGGPMSANDDLPWIAPELSLIRDAVKRDIPVLGHCLGGQLMAKALGGEVTRNPVKEIGWGSVSIAGNDVATDWFGDVRDFDAFHWHGETFSLPPGATQVLSSTHCANQGFALGKHLGLQCHVEMTEEMIRAWCEDGIDEIAASLDSPAVQTAAIMQGQMMEKLPVMRNVSRQLYMHWIGGLFPAR